MPDIDGARRELVRTMEAIASDDEARSDLGLPTDVCVCDGEPQRIPAAAVWADLCPTAMASTAGSTCFTSSVSWDVVVYAMATRASRDDAVRDCTAMAELAMCAAMANATLGRRVNSCIPRIESMAAAPGEDKRWSCAAEVRATCVRADACPPKSVSRLMNRSDI